MRARLQESKLMASSSQFAQMRKSLRLFVDDADADSNPTDISYAYSVYAPLSVRIIHVRTDWV